MSKAVLVIDMPKMCVDCKFIGYSKQGTPCCNLEARGLDTLVAKPDWCTLNAMPEYDSPAIYPTIENTYYAQGWNDCIDVILKGDTK